MGSKRDGLIGEDLNKHWGLSVSPSTHFFLKSGVPQCGYVISTLGKQRQETPWGLLASHSTQISEFQVGK